MESPRGRQELSRFRYYGIYDSGCSSGRQKSDWKSDPSTAGNSKVGAAYARQLAREDCAYLEKYTRRFNYPETSSIKWEKDTGIYGIKTYFCSNVCAAYKKSIYEEIGGFVKKAIFNEDMIYAGTMAKRGYGIA